MATARRRRQQRDDRKKVSGRRRAEEHKTGFSSKCYNLPDGKKLFIVDKEEVKRIEIIPYIVPEDSRHNPWGRPGELHDERTYFAHRDVGIDGDMYPCLKKTFKVPCPICDFRATLLKDPDADEDAIKDLAPKERQLWNVFDHSDEERGVQLWDVSFHLFGKQLNYRVKNSDEEDGYEFFADPEDGMTLKVGFEEKSFGKSTFYETSTIDFKVRREALPEELFEQAMILDELLIQYEYDDLKQIFLQTKDSDEDAVREPEEDEDKPPKKSRTSSARGKSKSAKTAEDDSEPKKKESSGTTKTASRSKEPTAEKLGIEVDQVVDHDEHGECTVKRISKDGLKVEITDSEDEKHTVKPSELTIVEFEDDEEEQEATAEEEPKEEEDDDDWDDFEDD